MLNKVWFRTGIALIMLFILIKLFMQVHEVFTPIVTIIGSVFLPFIISGFLFYICLPFQNLLEKWGFPRWASIVTIFVVLIAIIAIVVAFIAPILISNMNNLIKQTPALQRETERLVNFALTQIDKLPNDVTHRINNMVKSMGDGVTDVLSNSLSYITSLISTIFLLIMVPFFLIYMLKDHEKFIPAVGKFFKGERKVFVVDLLKDLNYTLKSYIQGQVTVSVILGIILYIGYTIIGLPYTPLLVLFAGVANLIPFLGPWLSFTPAAILGIIDGPTTFVWVCVITLIAQQLEGNVITPNVMGKSLSMHPLTIIVVILAAGDLGGFTLILIAVPLYAVLKTIISNIFKYRQRIIDKANSNVKD
ncbi:AI-2E family transporter [Staphylococcus pasteuri]|uniref:lipoteichoic acid biosynthesis protein CozEa n=1 Tax=Staphylococcus TaxID=1279 RepID=UPI0002F263DE|nr:MULTISPECIES: AI-2E family transporter [Staphylococcus]ODB40406.1 AI-2E family transporter [Staphylococcus sp. AOAB]RQX26896.1 AI-2E family transporter [Staphylococcus warneri]MBL3398203.1 AI-2E family transporter [Staphylococcus pasteuri]MBM6506931.1 AI-2E family transporter [Staphylococcus pasteuri]MCD9065823.1 AI-2E family transporter [Staphylococcus pasteuri]